MYLKKNTTDHNNFHKVHDVKTQQNKVNTNEIGKKSDKKTFLNCPAGPAKWGTRSYYDSCQQELH